MIEYKSIMPIVDKTVGLMNKHIETELLFDLASNLPKGSNVLEIGSYRGLSSLCLGYGCKNSNSNLFCLSYFSEENLHEWFLNMHINKIDAVPVIGNANNILRDLLFTNLSLIFIDSGHSYADCKIQFELSTRSSSSKCIVAFHDHGHPHYPGVEQYCNEITDSGVLSNTCKVGCIYYGYINKS